MELDALVARPGGWLVADVVVPLSGPVTNSLAQFEDAAIEAGIDVEFVFVVLQGELESKQLWLVERLKRAPGSPYVMQVLALRQRLWDQLARLRPKWSSERIEVEHREALRLKATFDDEFGPEDLPRDVFGRPGPAPPGYALHQRLDAVMGVRYRLIRTPEGKS